MLYMPLDLEIKNFGPAPRSNRDGASEPLVYSVLVKVSAKHLSSPETRAPLVDDPAKFQGHGQSHYG